MRRCQTVPIVCTANGCKALQRARAERSAIVDHARTVRFPTMAHTRIHTTVDDTTLELIDEEAARRGIPRARLLREAAIQLVGRAEHADLRGRVERIERHLGLGEVDSS